MIYRPLQVLLGIIFHNFRIPLSFLGHWTPCPTPFLIIHWYIHIFHHTFWHPITLRIHLFLSPHSPPDPTTHCTYHVLPLWSFETGHWDNAAPPHPHPPSLPFPLPLLFTIWIHDLALVQCNVFYFIPINAMCSNSITSLLFIHADQFILFTHFCTHTDGYYISAD